MARRRTFIFCLHHHHVIGEIIRRMYREEPVSALYVYEQSVEVEAHVPAELPKKRFIAIGEAVGIECSICHGEVDWTPSNKTVVTVMVGLLNSLYEPAARRDMVDRRTHDV
jgi:hypothetical protein